jgi:hypothetical protein
MIPSGFADGREMICSVVWVFTMKPLSEWSAGGNDWLEDGVITWIEGLNRPRR